MEAGVLELVTAVKVVDPLQVEEVCGTRTLYRILSESHLPTILNTVQLYLRFEFTFPHVNSIIFEQALGHLIDLSVVVVGTLKEVLALGMGQALLEPLELVETMRSQIMEACLLGKIKRVFCCHLIQNYNANPCVIVIPDYYVFYWYYRKGYTRAPFDDWRKPPVEREEEGEGGGWRSSGSGPSGRRWNAPSSSAGGTGSGTSQGILCLSFSML